MLAFPEKNIIAKKMKFYISELRAKCRKLSDELEGVNIDDDDNKN